MKVMNEVLLVNALKRFSVDFNLFTEHPLNSNGKCKCLKMLIYVTKKFPTSFIL